MIIESEYFYPEEFRIVREVEKQLTSLSVFFKNVIIAMRLLGYYADSLWIQEVEFQGAADVRAFSIKLLMTRLQRTMENEIHIREPKYLPGRNSDDSIDVFNRKIGIVLNKVAHLNKPLPEDYIKNAHGLVDKLAE